MAPTRTSTTSKSGTARSRPREQRVHVGEALQLERLAEDVAGHKGLFSTPRRLAKDRCSSTLDGSSAWRACISKKRCALTVPDPNVVRGQVATRTPINCQAGGPVPRRSPRRTGSPTGAGPRIPASVASRGRCSSRRGRRARESPGRVTSAPVWGTLGSFGQPASASVVAELAPARQGEVLGT